MGRVLVISSHVARGAVGLSAAVPALQILGHEVIALPTILLSNHPGHAHVAGERVSPATLAAMLDALDANGWLEGIDGLLTGYLPSGDHAAFAEAAVERTKARSPSALYVCDPVLGDSPKGLYIEAAAAHAVRDRLVPRADVIKMNRFEAQWLSGAEVRTADDAARAAHANGWATSIVTSLPGPVTMAIRNVLVEPSAPPSVQDVARRDRVPNGTGDLFGALWLGHRLRTGSSSDAFERAVLGVERTVAGSLDCDELQLGPMLRELAPP